MTETKTVTLRRTKSVLVEEVCEVPADYVCKRVIRKPSDIYEALSFLRDRTKEEVWALYLDARHTLICMEQVSVGTATTSLIHPREVFGPALRHGAVAIAIGHNHPSGDKTPSAEDYAVTRRLVEVGELVGVPLLDHLVVALDGYCAMRSTCMPR